MAKAKTIYLVYTEDALFPDLAITDDDLAHDCEELLGFTVTEVVCDDPEAIMEFKSLIAEAEAEHKAEHETADTEGD
jgi:hypothetical protein